MKESADICVLVLTYNHGKYITECLNSLLNQTIQPKRIKIFDDCSTDGTWKIVQKFVHNNPEMFVAHRNRKNIGHIENSIRLLSSIEGEYCAIIEGDDYWEKDKLKGEYEALTRHPNAGAAYSNIAMVNENGQLLFIYHLPEDGPMPSGNLFVKVATRSIFPRTRNCFRNYLFRTDSFRSLGWQLDKNIPTMGDYNLHLCFTSRFPFVASTIEEPMVFYRRHAGGVSSNTHDVQLAQMMIYEKYDSVFKSLSAEEELSCRLFQESLLSFMVADFPTEKKLYYAPGAVYERMLHRLSALSHESIDPIWRSSIGLFRQLAIQHVADLLRKEQDMEALAAWLRHYRNETNPLDAWFSLTPEIFSRLRAVHQVRRAHPGASNEQ